MTELARWRKEDEPCGQRTQELLERVARDDDSEWVRKAAWDAIE